MQAPGEIGLKREYRTENWRIKVQLGGWWYPEPGNKWCRKNKRVRSIRENSRQQVGAVPKMEHDHAQQIPSSWIGDVKKHSK